MVSPLDPALASIFFIIKKIISLTSLSNCLALLATFMVAVFTSDSKEEKFSTTLKSFHSYLKFTMEKEAYQKFPFLDVKLKNITAHF